MKLVVGSNVREHVDARGGAVYVWPRRVGCCRGKAFVLEAATQKPDREFELVHTADGLQVLTTPGFASRTSSTSSSGDAGSSARTGTVKPGLADSCASRKIS